MKTTISSEGLAHRRTKKVVFSHYPNKKEVALPNKEQHRWRNRVVEWRLMSKANKPFQCIVFSLLLPNYRNNVPNETMEQSQFHVIADEKGVMYQDPANQLWTFNLTSTKTCHRGGATLIVMVSSNFGQLLLIIWLDRGRPSPKCSMDTQSIGRQRVVVQKEVSMKPRPVDQLKELIPSQRINFLKGNQKAFWMKRSLFRFKISLGKRCTGV